MLTSPRYKDRSLAAEETIRSAFCFENAAAPHLIFDAGYWLFGDVKEHIPPDYCDDDPASMIRYQTEGIEQHVENYDDAYIPFLMPWYGTGVLASGFGVPIIFQDRMDPAVDLPPISRVEQLSRQAVYCRQRRIDGWSIVDVVPGTGPSPLGGLRLGGGVPRQPCHRARPRR